MKYIFLLVISSCSMLGLNESEDEAEVMAKASKNSSEEYKSEEKKIVEEGDRQEEAAQKEVEASKHEEGDQEFTNIKDKRLDSIEFSLADIKSTLEEMKSFLEENSEKIKVLEKPLALALFQIGQVA